MKLAFILFKYFPFGGLQRDFLRIASSCRDRGHDIVVYTLSWQGEVPPAFEIKVLPVRAVSNHRRYERFHGAVMHDLKGHPVDRIVGFNKMPGLDFYFVADGCYEHKARHSRPSLYRLSPRYAFFRGFEASVFGRGQATQLLMISELQKPLYQRYYQTEEARFHALPPGISKDRRRPPNALQIRKAQRQALQLRDEDRLLLLVGSGFKTKGLDRALRAFAVLPEAIRKRTHFIAIGQDNPWPFRLQAKRLGVWRNFKILPGRTDIPNFLAAADLLVHPAYHESGGAVLLEAIAFGLPVLASSVCGYGHYVSKARAGLLLDDPFAQEELNSKLRLMLTASSETRDSWQESALAFAATADIYSLPEKAADLILDRKLELPQRTREPAKQPARPPRR